MKVKSEERIKANLRLIEEHPLLARKLYPHEREALATMFSGVELKSYLKKHDIQEIRFRMMDLKIRKKSTAGKPRPTRRRL